MSNWEKLKKGYITQFTPTNNKKNRIPICFFNTFAANKLGTQTLFAQFQEQAISKQNNSWVYTQTGDKVTKDDIFQWFPDHEQVEDLNIFTGTAKFEDKAIYLLLIQHKWKYLNHWMVHFNGSSTSETENPEAPESEES
jgi:hypothetical protein